MRLAKSLFILILSFLSIAHPSNARAEKRKTVLFLGTSLTAGLGLNKNLAYPAVIQKKIDALNMPYRVINAGLSGDTSSGGIRRYKWHLKSPPSVLVLELGANDGLRGISVDLLEANLRSIIQESTSKGVKVLLIGMQAPPNMGSEYVQGFNKVFPKVAKELNVPFVPFLLEGVAGNGDLNQDDGIHPSEDGQKQMAETVWKELRPLL